MTSVKYSPKSAQALAFLKAHANDIDIFVEDTSAPSIWIKLIRQLLPEGTKLKTVNTLGGRKAVIDACKADENKENRPRLFIIDGDLDIIQKKKKPSLKNLYRLRSYCVENYLINKTSLVQYATTVCPEITDEAAHERLPMESWLQRNTKHLRRIFSCYAAANKIHPQTKTVSRSVFKIKKNGRRIFDLCPNKSKDLLNEILNEIPENKKDEAINLFKKYYKNSIRMKNLEYASAKDYILPLVNHEIKKTFPNSFNDKQIRAILAQNYPIDYDPYLRKAIVSRLTN